MATAGVVKIDPQHLPVSSVSKLSSESAAELSRLMQENHEKHHIYFNDNGFHNHIAHHLVSIYALGGTPGELQHAYAHNASFQNAQLPEHVDFQPRLKDPKTFIAALSDEKNYHDFLSFFSNEINTLGVDKTLDEYLFKGDERAELMFTRLFASILHPIIHLGLAMEFNIPAMVAEALAWTAVHQDDLGDFLRTTEKAASSAPVPSPLPSLLSLYQATKVEKDITMAELFRTGSLFTYAKDEAIQTAKQYLAPEDQLESRTLEALNTIAYVTMAAQRPGYLPKVDFFGVHSLNGTVFLPALQRALSPRNYRRVLEAYVRSTIMGYAAVKAPELHPDYVFSFARDPARRALQEGGEYPTWESLFAKANALDDDGHIAKAVRALKGAENAAGKQTVWEEPLKKTDLLDLAAVLMRSTESEPDFVITRGPTRQWVRGCGFPESWEGHKKL